MAKRKLTKPTPKRTEVVKGLSVNDILNMDLSTFNKLGETELRAITGRLVSAGNKRIRLLERAEEDTPALSRIQRSGGKLSTKNIPRGKQQSVNLLRAEFTRAKDFLEDKTSTVKGWNETRQKSIEGLKLRGIDLEAAAMRSLNIKNGTGIDYLDKAHTSAGDRAAFRRELKALYERYWTAYDRLTELDKDVEERKLKYKILDVLDDFVIDNP